MPAILTDIWAVLSETLERAAASPASIVLTKTSENRGIMVLPLTRGEEEHAGPEIGAEEGVCPAAVHKVLRAGAPDVFYETGVIRKPSCPAQKPTAL